jgi:preprotein translocase subunit SecG
MESTLLIIQLVLAVVITITVLLQKSSSMGLGAYSGSNESMFGAKGPGNFLTKATVILGFIFVVNTLSLGYIYNSHKDSSIMDSVDKSLLIPALPASTAVPAKTAPEAPAI